ncbi:Uncharacterised protein [Mycobacteroides abscessus]|nr:Uncharacterised protein [Mycobacteroides abscessus]
MIVDPPAGKNTGSWRQPSAPAYPPSRCEAGTEPEISKTHTKRPSCSSPQRTSCRVVAGSRPIAVHTRFVTSASTATPSSASLKCGNAWPSHSTRRPSRERTGGRWTLLSRPSARSDAGQMSLSPCWYWMPTASSPKSSAIRSAAMYILCCQRSWAGVSSVASSVPSRNVMPASSSQRWTASASSSPTRCISAQSADCDSRSL